MWERDAVTAEEWQRCADPQEMLAFLRGKASDRKLRLVACACCRRTLHRMTDERSRQAVEAVERFADGRASLAELAAAWLAADAAAIRNAGGARGAGWYANLAARHTAWVGKRTGRARRAGWDHAQAAARLAAQAAAWDAAPGADREAPLVAAWEAAQAVERQVQADFLRDIFGNPCRPPALLDPAVLAYDGGAARRLAQAIYEGRRFGDLPVLADLLEEAGCTDPALLTHLRGPGPHALGCWGLDLALGRQ
jgi:hypothetical protein